MTQQITTSFPVEEREEFRCRHYWVIQPADGTISPGVCQNCGESREFKNYVEASTWGDDKTAASRPAADVAQTVAERLGGVEEEE
jgi:hypothetical protein